MSRAIYTLLTYIPGKGSHAFLRKSRKKPHMCHI
nr:MAG TPA: hypothetical protein [Caudoviricetes sp.]